MVKEKDSVESVSVVVDGFTISHSFETYQNGTKVSHFVSMNFKTTRPVTPEEALILEVEHSSTVTDAVIYDALARGNISTETANEMVQQSRDRHLKIAAKLSQKLQ